MHLSGGRPGLSLWIIDNIMDTESKCSGGGGGACTPGPAASPGVAAGCRDDSDSSREQRKGLRGFNTLAGSVMAGPR